MPKACDATRFLTFSYFGGKTQSAVTFMYAYIDLMKGDICRTFNWTPYHDSEAFEEPSMSGVLIAKENK